MLPSEQILHFVMCNFNDNCTIPRNVDINEIIVENDEILERIEDDPPDEGQMANFTEICYPAEQNSVSGSPFEYHLQRYFYPILVIFGILGNSLNLTVLLNRSMRSRANSFLAVLAFADIIFLFLLLPNILINYSFFMNSYSFRSMYFYLKVHILATANWCASIAHWCVIAVSFDRLFGIRNPLYARATWKWWKLPMVIFSIGIICGVFTFYQHFEFHCLIKDFCSGKQIFSKCKAVTGPTWFGNRTNPYSEQYRNLISTCKMVNIFGMIVTPIILLVILNFLLLWSLRKRQKHLSMGKDLNEDGRHNDSHMQKTEHRVTLTVCFIVTMYTLTNLPSALVHVSVSEPASYYDLTIFTSTLVICGKASNFILFCLGSKHFRLRLLKLTQRKINRKIESLAGSLINNTTTVPLSTAKLSVSSSSGAASRRVSMPPPKRGSEMPRGKRAQSAVEAIYPLLKSKS
ncbi:unnamed protein product [Caenorhabditis angaria]|uniref:G-protein coupled receptors family 1 profile domain-containing protein n=1 Tax=Caenorhabditis angaria TaxID=860376 RepID=A0A9P1IVV7_9PELO|nr:unnamed protein product [Caenorhabditis angaria]